MRSHKDDRMQRGNTLNEDRSACLVSNLSEFRSPICHHFDLASMGMHPKFCKLRVLPGNLKTLPTWNPCLVRGKVFLGVKVARTGLRLESMCMHPKFCKLRGLPGNLKTLPTWNSCLVRGESFPRRRDCLFLSTGAILEVVPTVYCRRKQCVQEQ